MEIHGVPPSDGAVPVPTIQAAAMAGILEYTERGGGDVSWVVDQAKLTFADFARPENRLPLPKFVTLIEAASQATGDDCFGAHLGQICAVRELGLPGYLATFAPTVERALASFSRYYYLLGEATEVRYSANEEIASFTYRVLDPESWPRRQDAEQVITMIVFLIREWIGPGWAPRSVVFEHPEPRNAAELERILGCPVRFDCRTNTVFFDLDAAAHENPSADVRLFHLLSWFAETVTSAPPLQSSFKEQVLASIATCSNLGNANILSVARSLGLEARTFQRRLQAASTSFRELHEEYLRRQSEKLLRESSLSAKEIAHRLGYANLNSFVRAFRRWTDMTPARFREQKRA